MKSSQYPYLEYLDRTEYDEDIKYLFTLIEEFSLCWMAFEYLENRRRKDINNKLRIRRKSDTITVLNIRNKTLARIHFEAVSLNNPDRVGYEWSH